LENKQTSIYETPGGRIKHLTKFTVRFRTRARLPCPGGLAHSPAMSLPPSPLILERRVDFAQTDAAGILHFSTYFLYMEAAEAALFRELGIPLLWRDADGAFGFPRIDCHCKFRQPAEFDDLIRITLRIEEILSGRIHYAFTFTGQDGRRRATGAMTTACAHRDEAGQLRSVPLPERVRAALTAWKNQAC
jgi:acyl-CoA thioester hydrolase